MCVKSEACCHRAAWGLGHSTAGVRSAACSWQRRPARRTQHGGRLQVARSEPPGGPLQVCEGALRRAFARMESFVRDTSLAQGLTGLLGLRS